jgi:glycosyltransferase involved in cell wall biosynthesis
VCLRHGCTGLVHWLRARPRYRAIAGALRQATRIVACGRGVQQALAQDGVEAECLPLPVTRPSASYRRAPSAAPLVVYAGRLAREKGVDVLLRAFAAAAREIPATSLRVIGDGPERASLERLAALLRLDGATTFTGAVSGQDVEREMARAWALVAPSRWAEPLGLVAVEAIVRGTPVVASAQGGFAESVVDGVSGLLVPNGDVDALARALVAVASRQAFPALTVPDAARRELLERHDLHRHIEQLLRYAGTSGAQGTQVQGP